MNKLQAISIFRRVVELGSFKAAAEDLNLSKAAVSKNISELEGFLQNPLINRTTRKLSVTDDGQMYYHQIRQVLDDLHNADLAIRESTQILSGSLRISAPMSFGLTTINSAICEFMKIHPEIKVELVLNDQFVDLVASGFDLAIRGGGMLIDSSLKQRKLVTLKRILCASPEYLAHSSKLMSLNDLKKHNCLIYNLASSPTKWIYGDEVENKAVSIKLGSYVANNSLAIKQAAIAGLGVVLIPEMLIRSALQSKKLVPLLSEIKFESHALYVVYPHHKQESRKLRILIDFLVKYLSREEGK
ncbi:Transcriptional regulator, LysR family [hydrothermal vent metagenome]|uniref:Transcriptional regulator, LysR family n=1 Tax=hydrothermal vent metagenome TaxID=652676 RepID=A0A3B0W222_9ZZZZ